MNKSINVLIVEDTLSDYKMIVQLLRRAGYVATVERVESAVQMQAALDKQTWNVVISDYSLPQFDAPSALALLQRKGLDIPFIVVSGTIGEDAAVALMKAGAHDYLMKDKLTRLIPAVEREIREAQIRVERKQADDMLKVRVRLMEYGTTHSLEEILQKTLDEVRTVTQSPIGFYHFAGADQNSIVLQAWSTQTIEKFYTGQEKGSHYSIEKTGLWVDVIQQHHPVIHNEEPSLLDKIGLPKGHPVVTRELVVPIFRNEKIAAILGVGNKAAEYTERDAEIVTYIADIAWEIADRKRAEERIQTQFKQLMALYTVETAITSNMDLHQALNIVLEQVISHFNVNASDILIWNDRTRSLDFAAGRGFKTTLLQKTCLRLGEGYAGRAALEGQVVHVPDIIQAGSDLVKVMRAENEEFISYYGTPLIAKGQVKGVLEIFHHDQFELDTESQSFLNTLANQAAIAIDNIELVMKLQVTNLELSLAYDTTLEGWSHALDLRDRESENHSKRVTSLTVKLAQAMGLRDEELIHIRRGALLHDIGKLGIPDRILLKPGILTEEEKVVIQRHPIYAYEWLSPIVYLRPALDIPYCHHEKWDGSGYPRGLQGKAIPFAARIFAVVDVWDALCSARTYRAAWSIKKVCEYIRSNSGTHFDLDVVEMFFKVMDEIG